MRNIKKEIKELTWFDLVSSLKSILRYLNDKQTVVIDAVLGRGITKDSEGRIQLGTTNEYNNERVLELEGDILVIKTDETIINDVIFGNGIGKTFRSDTEILSSESNLTTVSSVKKILQETPPEIPESLLEKVNKNTSDIAKNTSDISENSLEISVNKKEITNNKKAITGLDTKNEKEIERVDSLISENKKVIDKHSEEIENIHSDIVVIKQDINRNTSDITKNTLDIEELRNKDSNIELDLTEIRKNISKNTSDISINKGKIEVVDKEVKSNQIENSRRLLDIENKNTSQDYNIEDNKTGISKLRKEQDQLIPQVQKNTLSIADNTSKISKNVKNIETNRVQIADNKTSISRLGVKIDDTKTELEAKIKSNSDKIDSSNSQIRGNTEEILKLKNRTDKNTTDISDLTSKVSSNSTSILNNENKISDLEEELSREVIKTTKIGTDLSVVTERVTILEKHTSESAVDLSKIKSDVVTNKKDISDIKKVNQDQKILNTSLENSIISNSNSINEVDNRLTTEVNNLKSLHKTDTDKITGELESLKNKVTQNDTRINTRVDEVEREVFDNSREIAELKKNNQILSAGEGISIKGGKINIGDKNLLNTSVELSDDNKYVVTKTVGATTEKSELTEALNREELSVGTSTYTKEKGESQSIDKVSIGGKVTEKFTTKDLCTITSDIPLEDKTSKVTYFGELKSNRTSTQVLSEDLNIVNVGTLKEYTKDKTIDKLRGRNGIGITGNTVEIGVDTSTTKHIVITTDKEISTVITSGDQVDIGTMNPTSIIKESRVGTSSLKTLMTKDKTVLSSSIPLELNTEISTNTQAAIILSKGTNITNVDAVERLISNNKINMSSDIGSGIEVDTPLIRLGDAERNINIYSLDETNKAYLGVLGDKVESNIQTKKEALTSLDIVKKTSAIDKSADSYKDSVEITREDFPDYNLDTEYVEWISLKDTLEPNTLDSFPNSYMTEVLGDYDKESLEGTVFDITEVTGTTFASSGKLIGIEGENVLIGYTPGTEFKVYLFNYDNEYLGETEGYVEITDSAIIEHSGYALICVKVDTLSVTADNKFKLYRGDDLTELWSPTENDIEYLEEKLRGSGTKSIFKEEVQYGSNVKKNTLYVKDKEFQTIVSDKGTDIVGQPAIKIDSKNVVRTINNNEANDDGELEIIFDVIKIRSADGTIFDLSISNEGVLELEG